MRDQKVMRAVMRNKELFSSGLRDSMSERKKFHGLEIPCFREKKLCQEAQSRSAT